jgi:membrane fusion protein (multidrug efflux system)
MDAKVDISKTDGRMLADASRVSTVAQTAVFEQNNTAADAEVRKIIVANGGKVGKLDVASGNKIASTTTSASPVSSAAASVATLASGAAAVPAATRLK